MPNNTNRETVTNIVVLATHGSFFVPPVLRSRIALDDRHLKNFSDFGTQYLLPDCVLEEQRVVVDFSRALGDPNRSLGAPDLFREADFQQTILWNVPLTAIEQSECLDQYYTKYHKQVRTAIDVAEQANKRIVVIDIHDSGNIIMGESPLEDTMRKERIPPLSLGDREGKSCDPQVTQFFAEALERNLGLEVSLNTPYKGGYVTEEYGEKYNTVFPPEKRFARNVIQLEIGRYLYIDESTQAVIPEKCTWLKGGLAQAILELSEYLLQEDEIRGFPF